MDQLPTAQITALKPSDRTPQRVAIYVQRRRVATLSQKRIDQLGLQVGQPWTPQLQQRVQHARSVEDAIRRSMNRINRRPISSQHLRERLSQHGYELDVVNEVVAHLTKIGALDDTALGRTLIEQIQARKPAGSELLRSRLTAWGLDATLIDQLLAESESQADDPVTQALELVHQRRRSMKGLPVATQQRRLWGLLARRGFDADTIEAALEQVTDLQQDADPFPQDEF